MGKDKSKRTFLSDLHMGDERSLRGSSSYRPYGWLLTNIPLVEQFLGAQLESQDVEEVVILGDLFDGWVIPTDLDPTLTTYYENICETQENKGIVENLRALAGSKSSKLSYVPGNHDMTVPKEFMNEFFPGIDYVGTTEPGWCVFRDGQLVAEHGNEYSLFCAPDDWTPRPPPLPQPLPLGYYFSRLVAHKVAVTGTHEDVWDIVFNFLEELLTDPERPDVIEALLFAIAEDARLDKDSQIKLGDDQSVPVDQVGNVYRKIFWEWDEHTPTKALAREAMVAEKLLAKCVYKQYFHDSTDTKIAICGHTHKPTLRVPLLTEEEMEVERSLGVASKSPASHIYANCGTWIDSACQCTYVETEKDSEQNRHYVRLKSYSKDGISTTIHERFVGLAESKA